MQLRSISPFALVFLLAGCGGSSPSAPTAAPPVPTPTPVVYSGSFRGTMTLTGLGIAALPCTGATTATQTGNAISFSSLTITSCLTANFGAGSGTMNGNTFSGTGAYTPGCGGSATSTWTGHFSGDARLMNLKVIIVACGETLQFLGELTKQ